MDQLNSINRHRRRTRRWSLFSRRRRCRLAKQDRVYFHYTTKDGYRRILSEGCLRSGSLGGRIWCTKIRPCIYFGRMHWFIYCFGLGGPSIPCFWPPQMTVIRRTQIKHSRYIRIPLPYNSMVEFPKCWKRLFPQQFIRGRTLLLMDTKEIRRCCR